MELERALEAIAADRRHGAGYLARKAVGLLAAASPPDRPALARRLAKLRPALPAIAAAVEEAITAGDPRSVLRRADAERRRVADLAARRLREKVVATISNSSLVARALIVARPPNTLVVVEGPDDEGHLLVAELRASRLGVEAVGLDEVAAGIGVVGCDALFDGGAFVNRRGTAALARRLRPRPVLVLAERWKRVSGEAPEEWFEPELFEVVAPAANLALIVSR